MFETAVEEKEEESTLTSECLPVAGKNTFLVVPEYNRLYFGIKNNVLVVSFLILHCVFLLLKNLETQFQACLVEEAQNPV